MDFDTLKQMAKIYSLQDENIRIYSDKEIFFSVSPQLFDTTAKRIYDQVFPSQQTQNFYTDNLFKAKDSLDQILALTNYVESPSEFTHDPEVNFRYHAFMAAAIKSQWQRFACTDDPELQKLIPEYRLYQEYITASLEKIARNEAKKNDHQYLHSYYSDKINYFFKFINKTVLFNFIYLVKYSCSIGASGSFSSRVSSPRQRLENLALASFIANIITYFSITIVLATIYAALFLTAAIILSPFCKFISSKYKKTYMEGKIKDNDHQIQRLDAIIEKSIAKFDKAAYESRAMFTPRVNNFVTALAVTHHESQKALQSSNRNQATTLGDLPVELLSVIAKVAFNVTDGSENANAVESKVEEKLRMLEARNKTQNKL